MKTGYKVGDAMTEKPIIVSSGTTLQECAKIMAKNHVGSLIVKDDQTAKGILTEQDIVRNAVAFGVDTKKAKVNDIMIEKLVTIEPDKDIFDALVIMRDLNIRQLPVVSNNEMVGLLTLKDILKIEPQLFDLLVEKFELREEARKPINKMLPSEGICQTCGEYFEKLTAVGGALLCDKCRREQRK